MKAIDIIPIFGAIALAILCYFLSAHVPQSASAGLLIIAGALAGWSIPRLSDLGKKAVVLVLLSTSLLAASVARADEPNAAPFAGHCFGDGTSTCLVPELTFDVSRVALSGPNAGKLEAGAVPVGAGYALLFGYDQWWASGPAAHAVFAFSQAQDNYLQVSLMATLARYAHVGVLWSAIGAERTWYLAGGLTLPVDLVTTAVAERKAKAVRAAKAVRP